MRLLTAGTGLGHLKKRVPSFRDLVFDVITMWAPSVGSLWRCERIVFDPALNQMKYNRSNRKNPEIVF
jgi:hypothetical protein